MTEATDTISAPAANLLRRLMALVYDAFLLFAITLGYGAFLLLIKILFNGTNELENIQPGLAMQTLSFAGLLASLGGYYFICWRKQGQTLGMKAWRLKLQQPDGGMASPKQCVLRTLLATLSMAAAGIGYLWCLLPAAKGCLHDIYTGTEVVVLPKEQKK
ncbi:MAG: RDD family protein [Porticoccaceae bacterium]|nr:RDD family protein [Porticoccaceae bacterium]